MTSRELSEWQAYWHIEPFGEWWPADFVPPVPLQDRPDPPAVQKSIARDIAAAVAAGKERK